MSEPTFALRVHVLDKLTGSIQTVEVDLSADEVLRLPVADVVKRCAVPAATIALQNMRDACV